MKRQRLIVTPGLTGKLLPQLEDLKSCESEASQVTKSSDELENPGQVVSPLLLFGTLLLTHPRHLPSARRTSPFQASLMPLPGAPPDVYFIIFAPRSPVVRRGMREK